MRRQLLAVWIGLVVVAAAAQVVVAAPPKDDKDANKPVIAVFRLAGSISEVPEDELFSLAETSSGTLKDLVKRMQKAGDDPAVKAVVLLAQSGSAGSAQVEELRQAMAQIREKGKEVLAYADSLSMREYVLVSGATRISVAPTGDLWINGLHGETPYIRGLLDKLGVQPDFLTCGAFKSAAEIFMREGPSKEADEMQNWLLDGMFKTQVELIAKGRNVDVDKARAWIDGGPYSAEKARAAGLIDAVEHK